MASSHRIEFSARAYRQFVKLDSAVQHRLVPAIDGLAADPRGPNAKKLVGVEDLYRIRVGAYRVVYLVEDDRLLVLLVKIGHRRDVYRGE